MAGTISALEYQKRNKDRVNVLLDGEFAFGLSAFEAAGLRIGRLLSDPEIKALRDKDASAQAYDRAVSYLGYRARSSAEIRRYLTEKEVSSGVIDTIIARLTDQGYVDDLAFARAFVKDRQTFKPSGATALRYELREKGIDQTLIDEVLAELDTVEAAYRAASDRARRLRGSEKRDFRQKVGGLLARRGFNYDTAKATIDRLIEELTAEDAKFFKGYDDDDTLE